MGIELVLDMAQAAHPERLAIGPRGAGGTDGGGTDGGGADGGGADGGGATGAGADAGLDFADFSRLALGGAAQIRDSGAKHLVFLAVNSPAFPISIMAAAYAGVPIVPLNYRLTVDQLAEQIGELEEPLVVVDPAYVSAVEAAGAVSIRTDDFVRLAGEVEPAAPGYSPDDSVGVVLFTSGTTSKPKAVLLRHQHLLSYLMQTVEFGSADEAATTLVSNPPYHVAGVGAVLSNLYAGRRLVYLANFAPQAWLDTVRTEGVTNVMLVPTMLARIIEHLGGAPAETPSLRVLSYGGARMPEPVLLKALEAFPTADFVNAYGLTETSSTIAVLGPDDHRLAISDPSKRHLLSSAGRPVPGVEFEIRSEEGEVLTGGETGLLWVRGSQISGEYKGRDSVLDPAGWFPTRDRARIEDGYLFIGGRADDTIIRGGENIAPAEIEDVLVNHPAVGELAVIGLPDDEWGERIAAVIVPAAGANVVQDEIRAWCRERLRGSRTPDQIIVIDEFPRTDTGKIIRPRLLAQLTAAGQA